MLFQNARLQCQVDQQCMSINIKKYHVSNDGIHWTQCMHWCVSVFVVAESIVDGNSMPFGGDLTKSERKCISIKLFGMVNISEFVIQPNGPF